MTRPKREVVKELKFCKDLMDRIVIYAEDNYRDSCVDRHHTVVQDDIRKLRRELNTISKSLAWNYKDY